MRLVKPLPRPLQRQIYEGVLKDTFTGQHLLNRKGEWGSNLPEKILMEGDLEREQRRNSQSEQKKGQKGGQKEPKKKTRKANKAGDVAP